MKEKEEDYVLVSEELNIKTQINNTYLLGEDSEGFFLLDQHAVHERILYEKLKKEMKILNSSSPEPSHTGNYRTK